MGRLEEESAAWVPARLGMARGGMIQTRDTIRDSMRGFLSSGPITAAWVPARLGMAASSLVACAAIELAMPSGVAVAMIGIGCLLNQVVT